MSSQQPTLDEVYVKWLDIPAEKCPPNHYVLLGVEGEEADPDVIARAADARAREVRPRCLKHREVGTQLLNQIYQAKICLCDAERKAKYDDALRRGDVKAIETFSPAVLDQSDRSKLDAWIDTLAAQERRIPARFRRRYAKKHRGSRDLPSTQDAAVAREQLDTSVTVKRAFFRRHWIVLAVAALQAVVVGAVLLHRPSPDGDPRLRTFAGHQDAVLSVAVSPDGQQVLTGSKDHTAILWDRLSGKRLHTFVARGAISCVAFTPDGFHVVTGSEDGKAIKWDAYTGEQRQTFEGHKDDVTSVAFSSDGRQLVTGSKDKTAILWMAAIGLQERVLRGHEAPVLSVAFRPDGQQVLTGSEDGTAILWDAGTGEKMRVFWGHAAAVTSVAFDPDGRHVLTSSSDRTQIVWDAVSGEKTREFRGHAKAVNGVAMSPDGQRVLSGSNDQTAILWDAATAQTLWTFQGHSGPVNSVAFTPNGRQVLTGSDDKTAILWDASEGLTPVQPVVPAEPKESVLSFRGHAGSVRSVAFSPDGAQVLTGSDDQTAILWDANTGEKVCTLKGHTGEVRAVAVSPDGRLVLTGSLDGTAILWERTSGKRLRTLEGHTSWVSSVAFSPDGRQVLTGSDDQTAVLWDADTGQRIRTFEGHDGAVLSVAFSPDGQQVLTGSWDTTAALWASATGRKMRTFQGHTGPVCSVAFAPDGRTVATGSWDKAAMLWDAASAERRYTLEDHGDWVSCVAFAADSRRLLTGSWDKTAMLWDATTGERIDRFQGHADAVLSVAFGPDGQQLLTGSADKAAVLWDASSRPAASEAEPSELAGMEDKTGREAQKEITVDLGDGVTMELVKIPADSFTMGDDRAGFNEQPAHEVRITKSFYLGKYEVTQEQWEAVMGGNASFFKRQKNPVEMVSWNDCQAFLDKLPRHYGTFRLPTEAQWEYACRAGTTTQYCFGDDPASLGQYAWYDGNSNGRTHPVGEKQPNAWGLYDMHGNVWEWCSDWYHWDYYKASPTDDLTGGATGSFRVGRGGSWDSNAGYCRSAFRGSDSPDARNRDYGFRVALVPVDASGR